jgi:predicted dehydrogenase
MKKMSTRRHFLTAAAAAASVQIVPRHVLGGPKHTAPSEKLNIAGIGFGGMGSHNLAMCARTEQITALCDVDHNYARKVFTQYPDAKRFHDYHELLTSDVDFDAVVIATPDHTHAAISSAAMHKGKHVYCQKPLTHDAHESRALARIAKQTGVATQLGIQGHSGEGRMLVSEWIWDGAIGEIAEVEAWCSLSYAPHGHASWSSPCSDRPAKVEKPPAGMDWDTWIGPAPMRPYHSCYHPRVWRCFWDFGCGMMGDRGVHTIDAIVSSLKLGHPQSIECIHVKGGNAEVHPDSAVIEYRFPARDGFLPLKLTWREGQEPPRPKELEAGRKYPREGGVMYKGSKGILMNDVYGGSPRLVPETAMKAYKRPKETLPRVQGGHEQDWIRACKAGKYDAAGAHFGYGGHLTEITLLGNVAKRFPGKKLLWDGEAMRITNHGPANDWVKRPYRDGWTLDETA